MMVMTVGVYHLLLATDGDPALAIPQAQVLDKLKYITGMIWWVKMNLWSNRSSFSLGGISS